MYLDIYKLRSRELMGCWMDSLEGELYEVAFQGRGFKAL